MQLTNNGAAKKRIIWLASEGWDRNNEHYTLGSRKLAAEGAIVLMLDSQRVPSFEECFFCILGLFLIPSSLKALLIVASGQGAL